jgi:hypothetical protein
MVGVVASLCGQVECDGKPRLAFGQIGAVQLVGCLGRRVAGVRAHEPRFVAMATWTRLGHETKAKP